MKKLYAILISLLFVASVFGVASIAATLTAAPTSVHVGGYIDVTSTNDVGPTLTVEKISGNGSAEFVSKTQSGANYIYKYKATGAGTIKFWYSTIESSNVVTILPKSYPMKAFMDILGFGKKK